MSLQKPSQAELRRVALYNLGSMQGGDPEVLEDLGFAVTPDMLDKQLASAKKVKKAANQVIKAAARADAHDQWIADQHLTHPSSEGPLLRSTPEEQAQTTQHIDTLRVQIRQLGDRPNLEEQ